VRTKPCNVTILRGRLHKAEQFMTAAGTVRDLVDENGDVADAYVTLCVHAGIAAADVFAAPAWGSTHKVSVMIEAIGLLMKVDRDAAKHLRTLLGLKAKAGYSHTSATADDFKRAGRAVETLVEKARRANMSASSS
jgi:hypothetical protein